MGVFSEEFDFGGGHFYSGLIGATSASKCDLIIQSGGIGNLSPQIAVRGWSCRWTNSKLLLVVPMRHLD